MGISKDLAFSVAEYRRRLHLVQEVMSRKELDYVILDEPEMMAWLAGYSVSENCWRSCVVPSSGDPFLLVRSLDYPPARQRSWLDDYLVFSDWEEPLEILAAELDRRGLSVNRIGADFQSNSFTVHRHQWLGKRLPKTEFVDLERAAWDLRMVKSAEEIEHCRIACGMLDEALALTIAEIKEGSSQQGTAAAAAAAYYKLGFDDGFVGPITVASDWDSIHGFMGDAPYKKGDIVHIELLPRYRAYTVRIMRSVVVGSASDAQKRIMQTLIDLQDEQIAAMRPGAVARDIDAIVREGVIKAGLRPDYKNITGYTLGVTPLVSQHTSDLYRCFLPNSQWVLEEGMILHMYTSAAGFAMSETVLVTRMGGERLTQAPRDLFEVI